VFSHEVLLRHEIAEDRADPLRAQADPRPERLGRERFESVVSELKSRISGPDFGLQNRGIRRRISCMASARISKGHGYPGLQKRAGSSFDQKRQFASYKGALLKCLAYALVCVTN
jgi:hypothetical protein